LIRNFSVPPKKVITIHNGFNVDEIFSKATLPVPSPVKELFSTTTILITHCRLSRQKNLFALIDIFREVKSQSVKLMILGDGELREELLRYCGESFRVYSIWNTHQKFDLDFDIYFMGYERNPYPFLHRASLYLMTSSWEGFPLSLCEAMASGVPVLAADCYTGPREIIAPEISSNQPVSEPVTSSFGVLMPLADSNKNSKIWKDTIRSVLNNVDLRSQLIVNGKKRVEEFDKKKITSQWLQLINDV
jgi:glycosyltransferase involved in cell wall biosynthesis